MHYAENGYMTDSIFILYLMHVIRHLPRERPDEKFLLFFDQQVPCVAV